MKNDERLKHSLMIKMGLPQGHPTDAELTAIIGAISAIQATRTPTDADWMAACDKYVPGAGTHRYRAEDTSDLNQLLMQILGS